MIFWVRLIFVLWMIVQSSVGSSVYPMPPISVDQALVLKNVGLQLKEELHSSRLLKTKQRLDYSLMISGLSRGCHSSAYMEALFSSLCPRVGVIVFGLQFDHGTKKSKADIYNVQVCKKNIEAAMIKHTQCDVLFFSLQFTVVDRPCKLKGRRNRMPGYNSILVYNSTDEGERVDMDIPGRVHMGALNIGRSWDWFNHFYKLSAQSGASYHVRARLDDAGICIPNVGSLPKEQIDWMAFNRIHNLTINQSKSPPERRYYPSDRFAIVPEKIAWLYFESWRIWLPNINCMHNVYASQLVMKSRKRTYHATGELVLDARLQNSRLFRWYQTQTHCGNRLVRAINSTHCCVTMNPECQPGTSMTYAEVGETIMVRNQKGRQCKINRGHYLK